MNQRLPARLLPAALLCGLLAIASGPLALPVLNFVFKPLTTLLIIGWAWQRNGGMTRHWVLAGLGLSLVGDVALLWPEAGFLPGLVAFLFAHAAYLVAFTRHERFAIRKLPFAAYAAVAATVMWFLWPALPAALRGPVLAYVAALACMAAQAGAVWQARQGTAGAALAARAALGGALFMTSDATLAVNKFLAPVPAAGLCILATYWLAQVAIAASLPADGPAPTGRRA